MRPLQPAARLACVALLLGLTAVASGCSRDEAAGTAGREIAAPTSAPMATPGAPDRPENPTTAAPTTDEPVLATVGDRRITTRDVDEHIRRQLFERMIAAQGPEKLARYRDRALDDLVDELVLEREARRRGVTPEELLESERRAVRDEEVEAYFERHRSRWGEDATIADHAAEIRQLLLAKRRQEVLTALREGEGEDLRVQRPDTSAAIAGEGFAIGPDSAPVTIVAFVDYASTSFRRTQPVLDALVSRHAGELRLRMRHLPDERHPRSRALAAAAVCAEAQGRFPAFHVHLLAHPRQVADEDLERYAADLGMDLDAFVPCLGSPDTAARIDRDVAAARAAGIEVSPGFWMNGQVIAGPRPVGIFERMIATHLEQSTGAGAAGAGW